MSILRTVEQKEWVGRKSKNSLSLSLFTLLLSCVMESWRVSKQNVAEATGCLSLSQHFPALPALAILTEVTPSHPRAGNTKCGSKRWTLLCGLTLVHGFAQERICSLKRWVCSQKATSLKTIAVGHYYLEAGKMLGVCVFMPPTISSIQRTSFEFSVNW